jgi:hypothetical protein
MKKTVNKIIICLTILLFIGCSSHIHTVGAGPQTGQVESARQWYILFGAIPLNNVDTNGMANGSENYEIETTTGFVDILIGIPASYVTVSSRTVTVTK